MERVFILPMTGYGHGLHGLSMGLGLTSLGLFPVDIRRPSSGVKLLGGAVSRDAYFISGLAIRRAANAVELMSLLLHLHDPQSLL
ncbi:hypothetical protein Tco_1462664 [Tanacetum coccineum]